MAVSLLGCASHSRTAPTIGVFGTLPLVWPETETIGGLINRPTAQHWALTDLKARGKVTPLDALDRDPLPRMLVMAQPRPLAPSENVAIDRWLRRGGRLLLFADPMLTAESRFALGDKRRPQDVVLLSPVLGQWRLTLEFDDEQGAGQRHLDLSGVPLPVTLAGNWRFASQTRCTSFADRVVVRCHIGKGRLIAVADAAILEAVSETDELSKRRGAFAALLEMTTP